MSKPRKFDWGKRLSYQVKTEMLATEFHLLTAHMPEIWNTVPKWLREQIKQTMGDCSVEQEDFSEQDLKDCIEYTQWLNKKYPPEKPKKKRLLHYALIDSGEGSQGQYGCVWGTSLDDVKKLINIREHANLIKMSPKDCLFLKRHT